MIQKIYEVTCDKCYCLIEHYFDYKPSIKTLREDAGYVRINNGKMFLLCKDCASNKHKKRTND